MGKQHSYRVAALIFGLSILVGLSAITVDQLGYSELSKYAYLSEKDALFIRPGLKVEVKSVNVGTDRTVAVTFAVTDDKGLALDIAGVTTPGPIAASFILAYLPANQNQYVAITTRTATSLITGASAIQASTDSNGRMEKISDGVYKYTLRTTLPTGYDPNLTHSIGMYVTRDLTEFELPRAVANEVVHFVPAGGEVKKVRDVVRTEACNNACHDPLQAHGGSRQKVELCVLCHTPQTTDPDTGNTVDFKVMIHKIHRGKNLPSVVGGTPYQIIGFNQIVHDFSSVGLPQDIRNCQVCHADKATQQDAYLLRPTAATCGSCHDDVNFATGKNHLGGPQASDNLCATCHIPQGEIEFDASIKGAHTIPYKSTQLAGVVLKIIETANTRPGQNPVVRYTLQNKVGQPLLPSELDSFSLVMAGPTTDYKVVVSEDPRAASVALADGSWTYQFRAAIPADATGTYAFATQGYKNATLNRGTTKELTLRDTAQSHSVTYAAVTDQAPVPRRTVVVRKNCEACHENLQLHGTSRHDPEYCVMCHQPGATDAARRPADKQPVESIHFKRMIHRIHTGEEMTQDLTIYGFGNSANNFNEVRFPGDRRNCVKCHVGTSYQVSENPPAGLLPTTTLRDYYSPQSPTAAACLGCHDGRDAAAHAYQMTAPFGESCAACHGQQAEFSVTKVHAR